MVNVSQDQIQQLLQGNNQAIADVIAAAVQAVVPAIQGAQAGGEGPGGPAGNGGDPFAKRLKAFSDIGVVKFSGDECPMVAFKWIVHAQRMVYMLDSVTTERARRELLSLQMLDVCICELLLTRNKSQCTKHMGNMGWTPLHYAVSCGLNSVVKDIIRLCPDAVKVEDFNGDTPFMIVMRRMLSDEYSECSISDLEIVRMLLEKDPKQCKKRVETHDQTFIHVAVKLGLIEVVETILKSKETEGDVLNIQDKDGNTPLQIAALGQNKKMTTCLLYDERVNKGIENDKKEKAIDLIKFSYDEAKAKVYSLGHQSDLKDQNSFDLLVAALIATVSFTAGITVPGGYVSDGTNKGSAILLKATAFKVFVVSNNFALLFSLYTVFLNFSTRRLFKEDDIYYESKTGTFRTRLLLKKKDMIFQLNAATLCTLSVIYSMVVAFITGSYAVLANSDGLVITVCVCSCFFLILASHATWTMAMKYWHSKPVPKASS